MPQRIVSVDESTVDSETKQIFATAEKRGAPNSKLLRILARDPNSLHVFYDSWDDIFYGGQIDHTLKEIVRVRMARLRGCKY